MVAPIDFCKPVSHIKRESSKLIFKFRSASPLKWCVNLTGLTRPPIDLEVQMREIPLTKGYVAIVDDEDFELVSKFKWCVKERKGRANTEYAQSFQKVQKNVSVTIRMHRLILGLKWRDGKTVDHINGDGLDNQRENLRLCTPQQNSSNVKMNKRNTSGFSGVYFNKKTKKWRAQIKYKGVCINLGEYDDKRLAAIIRDCANSQLNGEFSSLNF